MRILLTTRFYRNGQTTHVTTLCRELMQQGHQVLLLITQLHDPSFQIWLREQHISIITTEDLTRLGKHLAAWKPQIIHNHSAHTLKTALMLANQLEIPSLTTIHYLDFQPLDLAAQQDALVLISPEMHEHFAELAVPQFVVENGIELPPRTSRRRRFRQQALFLAQVNREKEKNFRTMSEHLLTWGWEVTSAGNWRHKGIKQLGWVHNVGPLLAQADLVIGTGRTVREGMAAGSVVWVLGAYSDGLVTADNASLLQKTNYSGRSSKQALHGKEMASFLQDPDPSFFHALGDFGRQYASQHFTSQNMAQKLVKIYTQTVKTASKKQESKKMCLITRQRKEELT